VACPPDCVPEGDPNVAVFIAMMVLGFVIGTAGHIRRSNGMVIVGIVLIFAATVVLPLVIFRGGR
jgi:hypothetical protein